MNTPDQVLGEYEISTTIVSSGKEYNQLYMGRLAAPDPAAWYHGRSISGVDEFSDDLLQSGNYFGLKPGVPLLPDLIAGGRVDQRQVKG